MLKSPVKVRTDKFPRCLKSRHPQIIVNTNLLVYQSLRLSGDLSLRYKKKKWETVQLEKISNLSFFSPEYKTVFLVPSDERPVFAILAQGRVVDNTKQPFLECQFILHARNVQR